MIKLRMLLVALLIAVGTVAALSVISQPVSISQHAVVKIADAPTPTPTRSGSPPGCGANGC